ncbi:hypothetical protein SDC9_109392 [bioreactor metagenome]|uniref:TIGR01906 family membrane protein n=1 Tax=bioreactor metagenome TaxID=1076179 RepID=A0A645BAL8_9ZZZZ|nr:TIGR01906 family membrane protein [Candidatus Metalachnospira sp.]
MNLCKRILMTISAMAMIFMLILTSASFVIFGNMNYYRQEFEKYDVTKNIDMSMDNIMYVMDELMNYLHNDRENLENIVTEVNGQQKDFFSTREKEHMADCKVLFDNGFMFRKICSFVFIALTLIMIFAKWFDIRQFIKICGIISIVLILAAAAVAIAAFIDFEACFIMFHKLFFDNDLWLLDPETDLIINVLVEDFFADISLKIGVFCMSVPTALAVFGGALYIKDKKRRNV